MLVKRNARASVDASAVPDVKPIVIERFSSEISRDSAVRSGERPFNLKLIAIAMRLDSIDATELDTIPITQRESILKRRAGGEIKKETVFTRMDSSRWLRAGIPISGAERKILIQSEVEPSAGLFFIQI